MNRLELIQRIEALKGAYAFQHGFIYAINAYDGEYPLLWCSPPVYKSKRGDNRSYEVTLYVFDEHDGEDEDGKEIVWSNQEDYLLNLHESIMQDSNDVVNVQLVSLEVDEFAVSNRGTLSTVMVLNIEIYDCRA